MKSNLVYQKKIGQGLYETNFEIFKDVLREGNFDIVLTVQQGTRIDYKIYREDVKKIIDALQT
jgi:hypothetical protein